jgi:hypothetical protein
MCTLSGRANTTLTMSLFFFAAAALVGTVFGQLSIIPLSTNEYSYQRGNSDSAVKVDLYIDLTCRSQLPPLPSPPMEIST